MWTSYGRQIRVMVVLVTQEGATVVTWSLVRTATARRERWSDVLRSQRGRGKNFRNVGDARSSCTEVLVVLSASIMRSLSVPVASLPIELSPYGVLTASFVRASSHGVCLKQFIMNAVFGVQVSSPASASRLLHVWKSSNAVQCVHTTSS